MTRIRSGLMALAFMLVLPSTALGITTTSQSAESLNVIASITLTGVPASTAYADSPAASTVAAALMNIQASSNNATGFRVDVSATALTGNGNTIAATQRRFNCTVTGTSPSDACTGSDVNYPGGTMNMTWTNVAGSADMAFTPKVAIPPNAVPGAYTGTLTFTAYTNP